MTTRVVAKQTCDAACEGGAARFDCGSPGMLGLLLLTLLLMLWL